MTRKEIALKIINEQFRSAEKIELLYYFAIQITYSTPVVTKSGLTYGTTEKLFENLNDAIKFLNNYNDNLELIIDNYKKSKYSPINNIINWNEFKIYAICPLYYFEPDNQTLLV